jgi:hypothetical protein
VDAAVAVQVGDLLQLRLELLRIATMCVIKPVSSCCKDAVQQQKTHLNLASAATSTAPTTPTTPAPGGNGFEHRLLLHSASNMCHGS